MGNYTVYIHTTPSGKHYIGITSRNPVKRWGYNGDGYKGQVFENAIKQYGWDNIKHEILFTGLSKEQAEAKEIELISRFKATNSRFGYNVSNGGSSTGKFTEATKKKISKSTMGRVPWNKGVPRTEDEKKKMSLSHIGKTVGPANGNYGKHMSAESKKKLSDALKGHTSWAKGKKGIFSKEALVTLSAAKSKPVLCVEKKTSLSLLKRSRRQCRCIIYFNM